MNGPVVAKTEKTVLFVDIASSTQLYADLGDEAANELVGAAMQKMRAVVEAASGIVEEEKGDELLCVFDGSDEAARGAMRLHLEMEEAAARKSLPATIRLRVGFAHGPFTRGEERLTGETLITAKRLVDLAKSGQILTTRETLDRLSDSLRRWARYVNRRVLKGQPGDRDLFELLWSTNATVCPTSRVPQRDGAARAVEVTWRDTRVVVGPDAPSIEIGRDATCRLRVEGESVSRLHARVIWDRGRPWLEDVSTNGSTLRPREGRARAVRHESAELAGEGEIILGLPDREGAHARLQYRCLAADEEERADAAPESATGA